MDPPVSPVVEWIKFDSELRDSGPSVVERIKFDSVLRDSPSSVEERIKKLGSVLRDCRRLLHSLAPAVVIPALMWCSGGDLVLPGSKLSLFLVFCLFCFLCVYSTDGTPVVKFYISLSYTAMFSFVAGRIVSHVVSILILYLDFLLAAFFLGIALAQRSNGGRAIAAANALSLDHVARCMWLATPYLLLLPSIIPKSDLAAGAVLCLCLILYSVFVGFRLGFEIILTLRRLRVEVFNVLLGYRLRFHAYFDPSYVWRRRSNADYRRELFRMHNETMPEVRAIVRGDRRSLLVLSLVLAVTVLPLLWCFGGQPVPVLATRTFSLIIISHLFCCILYYSTEATPLAKIFLLLSYTWLVAFFVGALLTNVLDMLITIFDSLLAAALFGVTLAQHRQRNGTETAMHVAFANSRVHKEKNRQDVYYIMGFMALCYAPILVWLLIVDCPVISVVLSFFVAIAFLEIIHISCVVSWLNGAVCAGDGSVRIFLYFSFVTWLFSILYALFGELVGVTFFWHCLLASTAFAGYYYQVHASYEEILRSPATAGYSVTTGGDGAATAAGFKSTCVVTADLQLACSNQSSAASL